MLSNRQRRSFLYALFVAGLLAAGVATTCEAADDKPAVTLTIDFGDGSQLRFTQLQHTEGMTVLDALAAAAKHPRGVVAKRRGSGAIAFVTEIDDLKNEGGNGRNWIFRVNGKLARVSAGKQEVASGDEVEWLFAKYEDLQ